MVVFEWLKIDFNFKKLIEMQSKQGEVRLSHDRPIKKESSKVKKLKRVNNRRNK